MFGAEQHGRVIACAHGGGEAENATQLCRLRLLGVPGVIVPGLDYQRMPSFFCRFEEDVVY